MEFITIGQFKELVGLDANASIQIIKNPKTDKAFASTDKGNFKVQQDLDIHAPIRFMYESLDKVSEGCIANVTPGEVLATLS